MTKELLDRFHKWMVDRITAKVVCEEDHNYCLPNPQIGACRQCFEEYMSNEKEVKE
jgi:hypothetical protein